MNGLKLFSVILLSGITILSCTKKETIINYEDKVITGNEPVGGSDGVSQLQVRNFVNNLYIDLSVAQPSPIEIDSITNNLILSNDIQKAKKDLAGQLVKKRDFSRRIIEGLLFEMLNGIDSADAYRQATVFFTIAASEMQQGNIPQSQYNRLLGDKLISLSNIVGTFYANPSGIVEIHKTIIDNYFYDEINMGAENYVISCFENLFFRLPTTYELTEGVSMCNGQGGVVLRKSGSSKNAFADIMVNSDEFLEGLIKRMYLKFLQKTPNSEELQNGFNLLINNNKDLQILITEIVTSKEYAKF
jgi:hypothetical protein